MAAAPGLRPTGEPTPRKLARIRGALSLPLLFALAALLEGCGKDEDGGPPDGGFENSTTTGTGSSSLTTTTTTSTTTSSTSSTLSGTKLAHRLGSFMVIGDWGWDPEVHGDIESVACQQSIADLMHETARGLGDLKFVVNVGDSFYPAGLRNKSDSQWQTKWRDIYSEDLRSVPWYSVYGNHDLLDDPCSCSSDLEECAQVNSNATNLDYFFMPNYSYTVDRPDLKMEVIALDMNYYSWGNNTCPYTACPSECFKLLKERNDAAFDLFYDRVAKSSAENLLVFSHYPTDYFWGFPNFISELSNASDHNIDYFGGHRHNVDQRSVTSIYPNTAWLSGGGGGWGCESYGEEQGFVVGEIGIDGQIITYPVLTNFSLCCGV